MLRGIVFDMDGVIVNSHPAHREAWQKFLRTLGRDVSDADLDFILEGRKRQDILRHFLGELSEVEVLNYGNKKDEFFREVAEHVQPVAGIVDFLGELARAEIPAAVATSASKQRTRFTLRKLNLSHHFRAVVTGDDVAEGKPNPAIYQMAAARVGLSPQNLLAIEDSPCGVQAARSAGMHCIGIGTGSSVESLRQAGAEPVIQNFVGLSLKTLKRILPSDMRRLSSGSPTSTIGAASLRQRP